MKAVDHRPSASLDGNHLEDDDIVEINLDTEPSETEARPHEFNLPLMADLFDNLQDKTDLVGGKFRNATVILYFSVYKILPPLFSSIHVIIKEKEKQCSFFRRVVYPICQRRLLTVKTPLNLWIADHQVTMRYYCSMVTLIHLLVYCHIWV